MDGISRSYFVGASALIAADLRKVAISFGNTIRRGRIKEAEVRPKEEISGVGCSRQIEQGRD